MNNDVYILGGAQTDFERNWYKEGKKPVGMLHEVIDDCLQNTGLNYDIIDQLKKENRIVCCCGNFASEQYTGQSHTGALLTQVADEFFGVPSARYEAACASGSVAVDAGYTKLRLGDYDCAIVIGWEMMKVVDSIRCGDVLGSASSIYTESMGITYPFPKLFAGLAEVITEKYGLDRDEFLKDLAAISCSNYSNAKRNPLAQTRKWYTSMDKAMHRDTATNPMVAGMLANSDCSQITDGAAAVVLISNKLRRELNCGALPVIKGMGVRVAPFVLKDKIANGKDSKFVLPWTQIAINDAYRMAGLSVKDIDAFETHDCFTSSQYMAISAFGIAEPGYEHEAIESGLTSFDGRKPINPSGGLIGCGHPVGATGVRMLLDIYKQVAGKAGNYQIKNANNAMMLNFGGSATTNYAFIVGQK